MKKQLLKNLCTVLITWCMALLFLPQFAQAQEKEAYVVKSSDKKTLTFYYDTQKSSRTGTVWGIDETKKENGATYPAWTGTYQQPESDILNVVVDASFKDFRPTTTSNWFQHLCSFMNIKGLENLNTSEVSNMALMFYMCKKLSTLNLSNFDTKNVQDMSGMFLECHSLNSLNISNFNTEKVQNMNGMF